jgi:hypothetical protein
MRSALRHYDAPNGRPASNAWFSFAIVHLMPVLKTAPATGRVDIVGDRRPPVLDCLREHLANDRHEPGGAHWAEAIRPAARVDPSPE